MNVLLGGKFEAAMIRAIDAEQNPERNDTSHPYYVGLNRQVEPGYFDRAATLATISHETVIAGADWAEGDLGAQLAIRHGQGLAGEWDAGTREFAEDVLRKKVLPPDLRSYIETVDLTDYSPESVARIRAEWDERASSIALHYLCRLLLQLREAQGTRLWLALDKRDIEILEAIAQAVSAGQVRPGFDFPDINARMVDAVRLIGPVLCFDPPDAVALATIRQDKQVAAYGAQVRDALVRSDPVDGERDMIRAMASAYRSVQWLGKVDAFFEMTGWAIKPINYIPVVGTVGSMIADAQDVAQMAAQKQAKARSWHLFAISAKQVGVEDYLRRKANFAA